MVNENDENRESASPPIALSSQPTISVPINSGTTGSTGNSFTRRLSSIFPSYIRRKSGRKDSIFASDSTTNLWPFYIEEKLPTIFGYNDSSVSSGESKFKFGWINGVYVS